MSRRTQPKTNSHPWKARAKANAEAAETRKRLLAWQAEDKASKGQSHDDYHDDYCDLQEKNFDRNRTQ